ncbi:MAG: L,D-transpeptidase [Pseudomonadota bacterium]
MHRAVAYVTCNLAFLFIALEAAPSAGAALEQSAQQSVFDSLAPTEQGLLRILDAVSAGDRKQAIELSNTLASTVSGFALLDALREDLRAAHDASTMALLQARWLASAAPSHRSSSTDDTSLLAHEAVQRWRHRDYPVPSSVPFVLALDRSIRHLIVVETSSSRLFLFRNEPEGLRLERDLYASLGRRGPGKNMEGDERTPLGIYFTLSRMDEEGLAERYGAHAFPLDYPNAWDRRAQRTGRGIWIHGVPAQTYSRPPLDSDGCVALTNPDIQWMAKRLAPRRTPVVIVERVPWSVAGPPVPDAATLGERIEQWLRVWALGGDDAALAAFYESPALALGRARPIVEEAADAPEMRRLALIQDPSTPDLVVASYGDTSGGWYRQYWRQDGAGQWRIAAERLRPPRRE